MHIKDFEFDLPEELIAQFPLKERDSSRLMVIDRKKRTIEHRGFRDIRDYLGKGDLLVLNDTRVIAARLSGKKATGGKVEVLLARPVSVTSEGEVWVCLLKNSKGLKAGAALALDGGVEARITGGGEEGFWECSFPAGFSGLLDRVGTMPLPPYIKREAVEDDWERYQTVFARKNGAVAAPTAGLHFTEGLLEGLKDAGVEVHYITLHTGPGTFMPVRVENIEDHRMHSEYYRISPEVFEAIKRAKAEGRRVITVGTTSTRALESAFLSDPPALEGDTDIFIYPGFEFRAIDGLLTNFHLPGSTLIMLVSALAGREFLLEAYNEAVRERYRFFSYGDAMLIL